jgi:S-layer homology domain
MMSKLQESKAIRVFLSIAIATASFPAAVTAQNAPATESTPQSATQSVTSTSQLKDTQPTDWAFPALQSLVERYGCISGYPDSTYRGQRALTRYEMAAALNSCLDKVNETLSAKIDQKASKEELAALAADVRTLQQGLQQTNQELAALTESVKRYYVIIPSPSDALLEKSRGVVPTAKISSSRLGQYIEVQGFNKRSYAEALNSKMRSQGFNSRVIFEN